MSESSFDRKPCYPALMVMVLFLAGYNQTGDLFACDTSSLFPVHFSLFLDVMDPLNLLAKALIKLTFTWQIRSRIQTAIVRLFVLGVSS